MKVAIIGATGAVGRQLLAELGAWARGEEVGLFA